MQEEQGDDRAQLPAGPLSPAGRRATLAALAASTVGTVLPATAAHAASFSARVDARTPGQITARIGGQPGSGVTVTDLSAGAAAAPRTFTLGERRSAERIASWSCDRRDRRFRIAVTTPGGTTTIVERTVRTPSCAQRARVELPTVRAGGPLRLTIRDTFQLGDLAIRACVENPAGRTTCDDGHIAAGKRHLDVQLGRAATGRSTITVAIGTQQRITRTIVARRPGGAFRLLATGDSMIQIVDGMLAQRLRGKGGRVISDAHISTGISKPWMFNWPAHAAASASGDHPDVTVVILGANDGFPFGDTACCGDGWSASYATRAAAMMRSYARGGRGRVIWLKLPAPRKANFVPVFRGVNDGLVRAAARFRDDEVTLLDLGATFTPGGTYRGDLFWNGRVRHVRQDDGVHFNTTGAAIVAELIVRQLRDDGFVR